MVTHDQFPMFRLATLIARQMSAPIAARIKEYARTHPGMGRAVCVGLARLLNTADLRLRLWSLHVRQPRSVPPMAENAALEYGANILGEAVIFTLGAAIIIFEVNRQAMKQEDKILEQVSAWMAVQEQLEEVRREVQLQQEELDRLHEALRALAQRTPPRPPHRPRPRTPTPTPQPYLRNTT